MNSSKKKSQVAKFLFKKSLKNGNVDPLRVHHILKIVGNLKPPESVVILKNYKRLIKEKIAKEEVIIEIPKKPANSKVFEQQLLKMTKAKKIIYKLNPKIVFGAKITHGDWIYDTTLQTKLEQLTIR
ncbi:hypothetical protein A3I53_03605 [Candidatus Curtissbacteria bacterium RIFCSPLOWO2_02_FULL_40_13b]|uniref:Uncharacterized protein n=3 Tax=Candidatus Curtissiibacteriota TaxID=1752717 RepID=A0A1F5HX97_9BACT|nr:MAG: hypothetical protein A2693_03110 [Candidatus Curtissbacteria bacterium RIFCSPHIGHO2_01_FULL_40_12]OGE04677.1 MAG: hypothetical protein A3F45_00030 [Candidatus Curtissbacteria bacterium RIFCSPHIGHO2_12_FULL_41_17]OGE08812.1 MAG: hypothetical protein A3I53_03605 [Candidatus Curtissbacteria bacterium RIFCSPLOWO2_02_FULL_40_13b]